MLPRRVARVFYIFLFHISHFFDLWDKIIVEKNSTFALDMPLLRFIARSMILAAILIAALPACAKERKADFTVAIDPGHGGHDTGCMSKRQKEKDVVL